MTPMSDLLALAARVEALDGPCRETDAAIMVALHPQLRLYKDEFGYWRSPATDGMVRASEYTGLLDDAATAMPAGWWWSVGSCERERHATAGREGIEEAAPPIQVSAATTALALAAAALRAVAAQRIRDD